METPSSVINTVSLSDDEILLLKDILSSPNNGGVNSRYKRLKMSTRRGQNTRDALVRRGLAESHDVATPHGKVTLLELTEQGRRHTHRLGLGPLPPRHHVGPVHEFWRRHATLTLEANGYSVEREARIPGDGFVDLCATRGEERLAVEIETGDSNIKKNLRKVLEDGFSGLIVVAVTPHARTTLTALLDKLPAKLREKVGVWTEKEIYHQSAHGP